MGCSERSADVVGVVGTDVEHVPHSDAASPFVAAAAAAEVGADDCLEVMDGRQS